MADKNQADAKAKDKDKKDKKSKKGKDEGGSAGRPSVANHPRARASVRRMKGLGGLAGFVVGALLAHSAGLSITSVIERALICGIGSYLLAWACAVAVWRQIVLAELRMIFDLHQEHVRGPSGGPRAGEPASTAPASGSANTPGS
jgi:hypothetical protein